MTFRRNCLLISLACFVVCVLLGQGGCGPLASQQHLTANVQEKLGRPLNPKTEVDIRYSVVGPLGIYMACNRMNPVIWLLSTPLLGGMMFGCAQRQCADQREWKTEKPCTCQVYQAYDWAWIKDHETRHCIGYGEW